MDLGLEGKVAVVTGAGAGIGLASTLALAAEGARVVAGSRATEALEGLAGVTPVALDLTPPEAPAQLVQRAIDDHGGVDVLVNNVGAVKLRLDGFLGVTDEDFARSLELNFFVALRATRAAVAHMAAHGGGSVVNVASVNAFYHPDGAVIDYGAAKAALLNLTKALSRELGPQGIRVNAISPGPVETGLWLGDQGVAATVAARAQGDAPATREQVVAAATAGIPSGRFSRPEEVATLVALLASPRTANVSGANYVIDGGLITTT